MSIADGFHARAEALALELEDRLLRYISSPQEHDLALEAAWPFVCRTITRLFPWELTPWQPTDYLVADSAEIPMFKLGNASGRAIENSDLVALQPPHQEPDR